MLFIITVILMVIGVIIVCFGSIIIFIPVWILTGEHTTKWGDSYFEWTWDMCAKFDDVITTLQ